jgi:hypothetical protein
MDHVLVPLPPVVPKEWVFADNRTLSVRIEIDGDYLAEHENFLRDDGRREQEDCFTKKDGEQWEGKCNLKIWPLNGGEAPECSLELDEFITSVSQAKVNRCARHRMANDAQAQPTQCISF